jgi:IS5 family transposase
MQGRFSEIGLSRPRKRTRREVFLDQMAAVVPWERFEQLICPHYPVAGRGRRPYPLRAMLKIHFIQQWFGLSDPAMEEALWETPLLRQFAGIGPNFEGVPDETTILKFRHLLEQHELSKALFDEMTAVLTERGLLLRQGTIVDATLIAAPPSTKNRTKSRDPEMKQTKKGNQWYFGMKVHIGADAASGCVHSAEMTSANVHDSVVIDALLHGEEEIAFGDSAYHYFGRLCFEGGSSSASQCGQRVGGGLAHMLRMACRTAGMVGCGGGPPTLFFPSRGGKAAGLKEGVGDHRHQCVSVQPGP